MGSYNKHLTGDQPQSRRSMYRHKAKVKKLEVILILK